jgi:hypothetical protein
MNLDPIVRYCKCADGAMRPIYDDGRRQYLHEDDGYRVCAVRLIPGDESDLPLVVEANEST